MKCYFCDTELIWLDEKETIECGALEECFITELFCERCNCTVLIYKSLKECCNEN